MARLGVKEAGGPKVLAFLDMIAHSEIGDALLAVSDDGYNVIVGSTAAKPHLLTSYADHPQIIVKLSPKLSSSAAGRYQFIARTWDALARDLRFKDFSPENQDRGAIELLREVGALPLIRSGRIADAIEAAAPIWASFPGAGYGQHENKLTDLLAAFDKAERKYADFSNVVSGVDSTAPKVSGDG
jgi:muramidase (phage lysozyme)